MTEITSISHPLCKGCLEILQVYQNEKEGFQYDGGWVPPSIIQSKGDSSFLEIQECLDLLMISDYVISRTKKYEHHEGIPEFDYAITPKGLTYLETL